MFKFVNKNIFRLYNYDKNGPQTGVCRLIGIMMAVLQEDVEEEHRGIISGVQNGVSTSFFFNKLYSRIWQNVLKYNFSETIQIFCNFR